MSLLQTVRTGALLPTPEATNDWVYPQASATREAGREPSREAATEQKKRPGTLPPGAHEKLQETLALLKQVARLGTVDTTSLQRIEANLILLKQEVPSETPEADQLKEAEATRAFLRDLARSRTPNSTSLHAIQCALNLLKQRAYADTSESSVLDEIQATLTVLKQTGLAKAPATAKPEATATGGNDALRDRKDAAAKSAMSNGTASASGGPDADALAVEIQRHQETKRSLANTEATVQRLNDELARVKINVEDFRVDRDYLKEQVEELEETIKELQSEIQRQEEQIRELEADAAPQALRLELVQGELDTEREKRAVVQMEATQREIALREAKKLIDNLEKRAQEDTTRLAEKGDELATLQEQLCQAREDIAKRDKKLRSAATEKKRLKGTVTEAGGHLKETAVVVGETVLNLNSELERLMAAIQNMETTAEPPTEKRPRKQK